jgi:hypothetical protein
MYADFEYYTDEYKGKLIPSSDFDTYASRASEYIDAHTAGKASKHADNPNVKRCECAIAEALFENHEADGKKNTQKTSEKVGDYSVTYATQVLTAEQLTEKIATIIYRFLWATGLLYRGL